MSDEDARTPEYQIGFSAGWTLGFEAALCAVGESLTSLHSAVTPPIVVSAEVALMATPIEELNLTQRPLNILRRNKVKTIADLLTWSEVRLMDLENFGFRSLTEVKDSLLRRGLTLQYM